LTRTFADYWHAKDGIYPKGMRAGERMRKESLDGDHDPDAAVRLDLTVTMQRPNPQ
jgi:hypothetical protein